MAEASLKFRLIKVAETRNYFLGEIRDNDLMTEMYKKTCQYMNHVEHFLIFVLTLSGYVSNSALLVFVLVSIPSSGVGIKTYGITPRIKK